MRLAGDATGVHKRIPKHFVEFFGSRVPHGVAGSMLVILNRYVAPREELPHASDKRVAVPRASPFVILHRIEDAQSRCCRDGEQCHYGSRFTEPTWGMV